MEHLSVDEIIEFLSLTELNDEAINLSATVNGHICRCKHCFDVVKAFQSVKYEFETLDTNGDFEKY